MRMKLEVTQGGLLNILWFLANERYFNGFSVETGVELKETEGTHTKASETVSSDTDYTRKWLIT